jgi:hypothetical protein
MEATELRIGNLVSLNGKEFKVTLQSLYEGANLDFKPLKLTEEWLLNFGYSNENRPNHFQKDEYTMNTHIFWDCNGMFIDDKNGVYVKYVHQLQNLYFALQQKELTTK